MTVLLISCKHGCSSHPTETQLLKHGKDSPKVKVTKGIGNIRGKQMYSKNKPERQKGHMKKS